MVDGKKLKLLREAKNLSQEKLAEEIGVDRAVIGRAERGTKDFSLAVAAAVAELLGCRIDDFIRREA